MFEAILQKSNETSTTVSFLSNVVANSVGKFLYNLEECVTFLSYYCRYKEIFKKDCLRWTDEKMVNCVHQIHKKYYNYILPEKTENVTFDETEFIL